MRAKKMPSIGGTEGILSGQSDQSESTGNMAVLSSSRSINARLGSVCRQGVA